MKHRVFGNFFVEPPDLSGIPTECDTYFPPNYTLHACSKCGIYCAEHDTHVCNQKLLEWLKK